MQITGHCHCGHISFTALVDPSRVIACHCEDCQRFSGGPFRAVLPTPAAQVQLTGTPRHYVKVADSGNRRAQAFCGDCGTQLSRKRRAAPSFLAPPRGAGTGQARTLGANNACEPENPTVLNIRLGCVDQRAELPPQVQIWGHSAMPWLAGLAEVPLHTKGSGSEVIQR
ncbi:MAG: hypothetical protein C4K60_10925 [Ideonella sp. MAG2]|nr:MAG: hypothetical protein C4K60_10925 [Ideonella sp. MAG2]